MESNVYIYTLCEPDTKEVRYVGQSIHPTTRLTNHIKYTQPGGPKHEWLAQLTAKGLIPVLCILEEVAQDQAQQAEYKWIKFYLAQGANLTNISAVASLQRELDNPDGAQQAKQRQWARNLRTMLPYLHDWRVYRLMTTDELALATGLGKTTIFRLERDGQRANEITAFKLARALQVSVKQLQEEEPQDIGRPAA
jgi:DNA-binding XRE family transcriptional regulator